MRKTTLTSLLLLSLPLFADQAKPTPAKEEPTCPQGVTSIIDLRHRESGGVGYSVGYTTLDYFLTAQGEKWEFLFNLRGHLLNNNHGAGNAGIGMRFPIYDEKYLVGANIYYDCRQSSHLFTNQIGGGLEWLGKYFDIRFNGYLPVGKQRDLRTDLFQGFTGNNILVTQHLKGALPAVEGEIGTPLPRHFYFAAGSYYLFEQEKDGIKIGNAWGGKIRGEVNLGKYFTVEAALTYDHIFHTRVQGVLSLNIHLGKWKTANHGERCLRQVPIMRNEIIPIQTKRRSGYLAAGTEDDPIRFVFVNNAALFPGNGSIDAPFASLKEAEKNSKPGDIIYVFPGDGTPTNMNEGIILKEDQVLASSGAPLEVEGVIIPAQTPGENPVITNIHPDQPVIGNPGDTDLSDFIILTPWDYIFGNWGYDPANDIEIDHDGGEDPDNADWVIVPHEQEGTVAENVPAAPPSVVPAPTGGGLTFIWDYLPGRGNGGATNH